jgi:hypothetical protein
MVWLCHALSWVTTILDVCISSFHCLFYLKLFFLFFLIYFVMCTRQINIFLCFFLSLLFNGTIFMYISSKTLFYNYCLCFWKQCEREIYFLFKTSDPPRLRTGTMLILKCFFTFCMLYKYKPSSCITLSTKINRI